MFDCVCESVYEGGSNEKNVLFIKCTIKQTTAHTHTFTQRYPHTQLCDWQRLLQTSTLKLSENHKRFTVCLCVCVYLWNFPQRKTHQKKKTSLNAHTYTHTHTYVSRSSCTRVCVHVCMYLWRRDANVDSSSDGNGDGDCETSPLYVSCLPAVFDSASLAGDASTSSQRLVVVIYRFHRSPTLATVTSPQNPLAEHLYLRSRCCRLRPPPSESFSHRERERDIEREKYFCVHVCVCAHVCMCFPCAWRMPFEWAKLREWKKK